MVNRQLRFIGLLIVFFLLGNVSSYSQDSKFTPKYSTIIPSSNGSVLLIQYSRAVPEKIDSYYNLTAIEIQILENNFKKILKLKSSLCCMMGLNIQKLNSYAFQYVGVIINGKKYIYINAFKVKSNRDLNAYYKEWKVEPVVVFDGGDSFWGALFELETESFSQLSINGVS